MMLELPPIVDATPTVRRLDFLPIALTFLRKLRVAELIDAAIPPRPPGPQSAIAAALGMPPPVPPPSVGTCAEAMILNVLEGRVALCQMEDWLRGLAVDTLWGPEVQPAQFTDDRLALALDALFAAGTETLYSQIVVELVRAFHVSLDRLHFDTTSLSTYGAHAVPDALPGPRAVPGYSKDHRPDLLQWVFGMTVQHEGLPILSTLQDGNTADSLVHRAHLDLLQARVLDPTTTTFVFDSKGCNAESLGLLRAVGFHATTLMPHTFADHATLVSQALATPADWCELARRPGETQDDPERLWRGCAVPHPMTLRWPDPDGDGEGSLCQEKFTALVVHSSELQRTHAHAAAERRVRARTRLRAPIASLAATAFACADDAAAAADRFVRAHPVEGLILRSTTTPATVTAPRRRGRPRTGELPVTTVVHRVVVTVEDDVAVQQAQHARDGMFILLTSRRLNGAYPATKVFEEYQGQQVVEAGFRWLKGPGQVAPIFLQTPARIDALSFLFTVTLLLYRLVQREMRQALDRTGQTIPGPNRVPTRRPTTQALMRRLTEIYLVTVPTPTGPRTSLAGWLPLHAQILHALDLPPDLYLDAAKIRGGP